jgi:hypothetical protein
MNKPKQDLAAIVNEAAETLASFVARQAQQLVKLVTKPPKKPALSWDSILGERLTNRPRKLAPDGAADAGLPELDPQLALLPPEILDKLVDRIQRNVIDEVQAMRLYEKLYECEVQILRGHVHFYVVTSDKQSETIDYTALKERLLKKFSDHRQLAARHAAALA